jgi:hypothetical protein
MSLIFRVSEENLDMSNSNKQLLMPVFTCNVLHYYRMCPIGWYIILLFTLVPKSRMFIKV